MSTQVFANIMTRAVYYARKTTFHASKATKDKIDIMMLELQDEYVCCCLNCKCLEVWGWVGLV